MAENVFGNPVTDETVRLVYPTLNQITARHRAEVALLYRNAEEKAANVTRFVHNLKAAYGTGTSTLCMIYNATGGPLRYVLNHTWEGQIWRSPYPHIIQNGQWAGFLHVRSRLIGPSKEAVVYSGVNNDSQDRAWMLSWNTRRIDLSNAVYNQIRTTAHFNNNNVWDDINNQMKQRLSNHRDTWGGCFSAISVGAGSSPELVATMTLEGLENRFMDMATDISVVSQSLDSKYVDEVEGGDEADDATLSD